MTTSSPDPIWKNFVLPLIVLAIGITILVKMDAATSWLHVYEKGNVIGAFSILCLIATFVHFLPMLLIPNIRHVSYQPLRTHVQITCACFAIICLGNVVVGGIAAMFGALDLVINAYGPVALLAVINLIAIGERLYRTQEAQQPA